MLRRGELSSTWRLREGLLNEISLERISQVEEKAHAHVQVRNDKACNKKQSNYINLMLPGAKERESLELLTEVGTSSYRTLYVELVTISVF